MSELDKRTRALAAQSAAGLYSDAVVVKAGPKRYALPFSSLAT